jgi:hypothetical protein
MRLKFTGWLTLMVCGMVVAGCRARGPAKPMPIAPPPPAQAKQVATEKAKKDQGEAKAPVNKAKDKDKAVVAAPFGEEKPVKLPTAAWTAEVKGWGAFDKAPNNGDEKAAINSEEAATKRALAAAEKHALENARQAINRYLESQNPPFVWKLPEDYKIKTLFTKDEPRRCPEDDNVVDNKKMQCWSWTIAIPPQKLEEMRRQDSHYRIQLAVSERSVVAQERMVELSKLLAWVMLALVGLCIYFRVDEWSRGSHRPWLRIALASLLGVGGAGWWLLS